MKYTWWILLTIAGILSLTSVYGFILCLGSFGMLALNVGIECHVAICLYAA